MREMPVVWSVPFSNDGEAYPSLYNSLQTCTNIAEPQELEFEKNSCWSLSDDILESKITGESSSVQFYPALVCQEIV
jgi:hypothetical protein